MYICLNDKNEIKEFLEQDPYLHIYSLGDLDDFFWPFTSWYGSRNKKGLQAIILVYKGPELPTVCALCRDNNVMGDLLDSVQNILPDKFYSHLSPGLENVLNKTFFVDSGAKHYKMALLNTGSSLIQNTSNVLRLSKDDLLELNKLYAGSYPGNWFDPRMLETDQYYGIKDGDRIKSVAGVHVFSKEYKVAAVGNIVTHHEFRGHGYGASVTSALCKSLLRKNVRIGLNVQSDNISAVRMYERLGFEIIASFSEFEIYRK